MNIPAWLDRVERRIGSAHPALRWMWKDPATAVVSGMTIGFLLTAALLAIGK